jgi:GT2 family glycosyltransferase
MMSHPFVSIVIPTYNRKEKLVRLINSILQSSYLKDKLEIIVVDDASNDGTFERIKTKLPKVKIMRSEKELFLAGSRNIGIKNARGDYIFLIDDDNVIDKDCISELINVIEKDFNQPIGIAAPIMYYLKQPNRIWCAGIERDMTTSLTKYIGRNKTDNGQFNELIESKDFPNAFMIRRIIIERVGTFDEKLFPIHYDEADFGERVRRAGYKIICNPKAKIWHDVPLPKEVQDKTRFFHCHNELRAYYCGRNRIIFHKKYSRWGQFLVFILLFNWLFTLYYLKIILFESKMSIIERTKIAKSYLKGLFDGIF